MGRQVHGHAVLEVDAEVADDVVARHQLLVVLGVHEVVLVTVLVQEGVLALVHGGALDHFGRAVTLRHLHSVGDAAHVELGHRRALAGVDVFGAEHDVELAVHVEDGALAQGTGDDFHVSGPWVSANLKSADESGGDSLCTRTYTIITKFASPPIL